MEMVFLKGYFREGEVEVEDEDGDIVTEMGSVKVEVGEKLDIDDETELKHLLKHRIAEPNYDED
jgi:hypothetical protein